VGGCLIIINHYYFPLHRVYFLSQAYIYVASKHTCIFQFQISLHKRVCKLFVSPGSMGGTLSRIIVIVCKDVHWEVICCFASRGKHDVFFSCVVSLYLKFFACLESGIVLLLIDRRKKYSGRKRLRIINQHTPLYEHVFTITCT